MEKRINISEFLKYCPKGMELDCTLYDNCTFEGIEDIGYIDILVKTPSGTIRLTKEGCFIRHDENAKCVIFPKGKTTWEGFVPPCQFKDGDILYVDTNDKGDDDDCYKYVFIFEEMVGCDKEEIYGRKVMVHCYMTMGGYFKPREVYLVDSTYPIRFATEKEKQKLFQTIKDNGYKWNEKTKALEKLIEPTPMFKAGDKIKHKENTKWVCTIREVEDRYYVVGHPTRLTILFSEQDKYELVPNKFDINALKTFDQVLVRLTNNCVWMPKLFSHYDPTLKSYPFVTIDNLGYPQCIPYEKNRHLCRTTDDCNKFYKVWE
jgi:hypothetical protein